MEVGVRELKARLSEYLGRAAAGEEVIVTDRGTPVVRLTPFLGGSAVERGIEEGWVEAPRRVKLAAAHPQRSARSVIEVLDEDRG